MEVHANRNGKVGRRKGSKNGPNLVATLRKRAEEANIALDQRRRQEKSYIAKPFVNYSHLQGDGLPRGLSKMGYCTWVLVRMTAKRARCFGGRVGCLRNSL